MDKDRVEFLLERTLKKLDPGLHRRFSDTGFALQRILDRYRVLFPEFTDHTQLHCMTVMDFCNVLIGEEQIKMMNVDELYILLMACYLHDAGMAISERDLEEFKEQLDYDGYFKAHPDSETSDFVREYHHDLSGLFIRKYADMFDIPTKEHVFAIVQVSRGHRRTDLYDPAEYPAEYEVPGGNKICLPYLSSLIRLSDEIDVAASRNPVLLYDIEAIVDDKQFMEHLKHKVIQKLITTEDAFTLCVKTEDDHILREIEKMRNKMQATLDYCRDVNEKRSRYRITQERVDLIRVQTVKS